MEGAKLGMEAIVEQLKTGITADTLFSTVSTVIPFVIVMVMFAFGWKVLRRAIKKASSGKAGV